MNHIHIFHTKINHIVPIDTGVARIFQGGGGVHKPNTGASKVTERGEGVGRGDTYMYTPPIGRLLKVFRNDTDLKDPDLVECPHIPAKARIWFFYRGGDAQAQHEWPT